MPDVSDHPPPIIDGIAASASLLCLAHCLAVPMLAASLPVLGLFVACSVPFHAGLLALALPLGVWALSRGRRLAGPTPLVFGVAGFSLMGAALLIADPFEQGLTIAGVTLVGIAHWRNWQAGKRDKPKRQTSDASSIL